MTDELQQALIAIKEQAEREDGPSLIQALIQRFGAADISRHLYQSIATTSGDERPRLTRAGQYIRETGDPPPSLIDRLLPEKSLILLSGKPKFGKSFASLDLAHSVATGSKVWGEFDVHRPGPVAYLGMEDGRFEIVNRLLKRGIKPNDDDTPLYITESRIKLSDGEGIALLTQLIADIAPPECRLVIVDTGREGLSINDWNDQGEVVEKLRGLRNWARAHCSVLVVAHNRKGDAVDHVDAIAGSNAVASSVDGFISAFKKQDVDGGHRRLWIAVEGRGSMRGEHCIEMNTDTLRFRYVPESEAAEEQQNATKTKREGEYKKYADAITALGGSATLYAIADSMKEDYQATRKRILAGVTENAFIESGTAPPTGKGRPSPLYSVSPDLLFIIQSPIGNRKQIINAPSQNTPAAAPYWADIDNEKSDDLEGFEL